MARKYILITIAATAAFVSADLLYLPFTAVRPVPYNIVEIARLAVCVSGVYVAAWLTIRRLSGDQKLNAAYIRRIAETVKFLAVGLALFGPFSFASSLFMYMASATSRPLMDPDFARIDAALGFDWVRAVEAANSSPLAAWIMMFCYHALGPLTIGIPIVFAMLREIERSLEFIAVFAVSSVFTGALLAAFPSADAYAFYAPAPEIYSNFTGMGGLAHLNILAELRSGDPFDYQVSKTIGLVAFPSFHVALGIISVYCPRQAWLVILMPLATINAIMILATVPEGGHHLTDIIAGATVAIASILIVRFVADRERATNRAAALSTLREAA